MAKLRWAREDDIIAIKQIADDNKDALGFITRTRIKEGTRRREFLVCEQESNIVGFVSFHHRRDGWTTIYDVCVKKSHTGRRLAQVYHFSRRFGRFRGARLGNFNDLRRQIGQILDVVQNR